MTKQNPENARQADNLMKTAIGVVEKAVQSMIELTGATERISEISNYGPFTFTADITQQIPDKLFQLSRAYGRYSNHMRGDRLKVIENKEIKDYRVPSSYSSVR